MEAFNVEDQNRVEMMIESVDLIQKMWTEAPPHALKGKYWTISNEKHVWPVAVIGGGAASPARSSYCATATTSS